MKNKNQKQLCSEGVKCVLAQAKPMLFCIGAGLGDVESQNLSSGRAK